MMTVGELMEALAKMPTDFPVGVYVDETRSYKPITDVEQLTGAWTSEGNEWIGRIPDPPLFYDDEKSATFVGIS